MSWHRPTLNIDLARSHGAYAYDLITQREVLDLFGMFSSMPLGYSCFTDRFDRELWVEARPYVQTKFALGAVDCPAAQRFRSTFSRLAHTSAHPHHFFTNTGSQAVEAALKAAMERSGHGHKSQYIAISRSFHGVYGYAASAAYSLDCINEEPWSRVRDLPVTTGCRVWYVPTAEHLEDWLDALLGALVHNPVAAVIVEPIQCSAGDTVLDPQFLRGLRDTCTRTGTPLIFDEIQTGFGATGAFWHYEKLGIVPDVVVFGKKAQVSGFMSNFEFDARKLASTWQGDVIDMIRATHILEEYERDCILTNVCAQSEEVENVLRAAGLNFRNVGMLFALDFDHQYSRDQWCARMWDAGVLVNPTGEKCVRLRPPLNIDDATIADLANRLEQVSAAISYASLYCGYVP